MFKGLKLETGDIIALQSKTVPLPELYAAVIGVKEEVLEVFSTMLVFFQHNGYFATDDVEKIQVVHPAEFAIPQESRGKGFLKNQVVSVVVKTGQKYIVKVVAAFDGIVIAQTEDNQYITGGASYFDEIT